MQSLGRLLSRGALGHEDQTIIQAAAIVAAATQALEKELHLLNTEAKPIAYRRGEVIIRVSHGAIGGQIIIHQEKLLAGINTAVQKLYPNKNPVVEKIVIRQQ